MAVSSYGSARIRVVAGALVAGDARIPLAALGDAEVLDAEEARAWRTHKADPRAFMLLRSYIPTAVRVEVTDPADPTPYVYLSTREPQAWWRRSRRVSGPVGPAPRGSAAGGRPGPSGSSVGGAPRAVRAGAAPEGGPRGPAWRAQVLADPVGELPGVAAVHDRADGGADHERA